MSSPWSSGPVWPSLWPLTKLFILLAHLALARQSFVSLAIWISLPASGLFVPLSLPVSSEKASWGLPWWFNG